MHIKYSYFLRHFNKHKQRQRQYHLSTNSEWAFPVTGHTGVQIFKIGFNVRLLILQLGFEIQMHMRWIPYDLPTKLSSDFFWLLFLLPWEGYNGRMKSGR